MAEWLKDFRQASFKGFNFFVKAHTATEGRNVQQNEFVGGKKPFTEDISKKGISYSFEAYIVGEDYFQARDSFRGVLNEEGPGELIHPYLGRLFVQSGEFSFSENSDELNIVTFSLNFFETDESEFPKASVDKIEAVDSAALAVESNALTDFEGNYSLLSKPGFLFDSAKEAFGKVSSAFSSAVNFVKDSAETIADMAYFQKNFLAQIDDLISLPGQLAQYVKDSLDLLSDSSSEIANRFGAFKSLYDIGEPLSAFAFSEYPATTDTRLDQIKNDKETKRLVQTLSASKSAIEAVRIDYASRDDAIIERDNIVNKIDSLILDETISEETFQSLQDLKAAVIKAIPTDDLENLIQYEVLSTTNTILVSYDSSESQDNEQDIIDRNNIEDPGTVKVGTLSVLP